MIVNEVVTGIIVLVIGYLLGSTPSAYIVTRLATGKDIRQMGGGNVGGFNVFREVGIWQAGVVGLLDIGKGAAAIAIAHWLLDLPLLFVMLAGVGAVMGHNWMMWLKLSGGKGMGPAIGALSVLFPVYGYWQGLVIFFGIVILVFMITRNVALSMGAALLSLPLIVWFGTNSGTATVFSIVLGLIILIKFFPTAQKAWVSAETLKDWIFDRWQRNRR